MNMQLVVAGKFISFLRAVATIETEKKSFLSGLSALLAELTLFCGGAERLAGAPAVCIMWL